MVPHANLDAIIIDRSIDKYSRKGSAMPIDLAMFANKLQRYCNQFSISYDELSRNTGIPLNRINNLIEQKNEPTGDEILILADFFKCDFKFFISNEKLASFEQTESLFRMHGTELSKEDRWAIQEFLFLCECQEFLLSRISSLTRRAFIFTKAGKYYKKHGEDAAIALRKHLNYKPKEVSLNIYRDFRDIGIHIFRRKLERSAISGLFIRHPIAGPCILVNYSEDIFRQRFSAAHEAAHAILDDASDFVVSLNNQKSLNLSEIRANTFASHLLMPQEFLKGLPKNKFFDPSELIDLSVRMMVNPESLSIALKEAGLITENQFISFRNIKIPLNLKSDPELPQDLSPKSRIRKEALLQRGLSDLYVELCFLGYENGFISAGRLAEMLLATEHEIIEIAELYRKHLNYGN